MPFLDFSKPKMIDMRKKINFVTKERNDEAAQPQQLSNVNNTGTAAPVVDNMSVSESWVELAPSRTSLCSSVDINMVIVDEKDKDSRLSPVSIQSPHVEFENLEQVKYKLIRDMLPPGRNTDWIWDWNSRPENIPPKTVRMIHYGSNLTTPPNSPEPDLNKHIFPEADSMFNVKLIISSLMPNFFSFIIGAAIGFAICSKFSRSREI